MSESNLRLTMKPAPCSTHTVLLDERYTSEYLEGGERRVERGGRREEDGERRAERGGRREEGGERSEYLVLGDVFVQHTQGTDLIHRLGFDLRRSFVHA